MSNRKGAARKSKVKEALIVAAREEELAWLSENRTELKGLAGKWIVLQGNNLIASDESYERAREAATRIGVRRPFIFYVPKRREVAFMGI